MSPTAKLWLTGIAFVLVAAVWITFNQWLIARAVS